MGQRLRRRQFPDRRSGKLSLSTLPWPWPGAQAEEQMQRAIASRDIIGQAKGIIMERFHVTAGLDDT